VDACVSAILQVREKVELEEAIDGTQKLLVEYELARKLSASNKKMLASKISLLENQELVRRHRSLSRMPCDSQCSTVR